MDFVTFVKEKKRMCDTFHDCDRGCPLFGLGEPFEFCSISCMKHPEKAQEIVELWSSQNPEKKDTRLSELLKGYPNTPLRSDGIPDFCVKKIGYMVSDCSVRKCVDCWNKEV